MEDRKSQIIQVALQLIMEYGYDSFSYKDLSEAVGITKATLHHHFAKKENLGIAILQVIKEQLDQLEVKTLAIPHAKEQLIYMFKNMRGTLTEKSICPISSIQAEYNVVPASIRNLVEEISQKELALLTNILQSGLENGEFNYKGTPETMALIILTSYKGSIMYARTIDNSLIDHVINGLIQQVAA